MNLRFHLHFVASLVITTTCSLAQEKSVRPGINDSFVDPNAKDYVERFEIESREVFSKRSEIAKACELTEGLTVADIGAGTGIFTRIFAKEVGSKGTVIAVDIAQNFLDHITVTGRELGQTNIQTILCTADSTKLPPNSIDVAYICDTYHHFEFPIKTMQSLHAALKPNGRLILIDFKRIEGQTSDRTMKHVRAGQEVFESEIVAAGFKKVKEHSGILEENYFVEFEKTETLK